MGTMKSGLKIPYTAYLLMAVNMFVIVIGASGEMRVAVWEALHLNPAAVRNGEVWRLVTFTLVPAGGGAHGVPSCSRWPLRKPYSPSPSASSRPS